MEVLRLIDNINSTLRDDLMQIIRPGSRVSIAAASFSIYAFQEIKEQLKDIDELRFIFTSPSFTTEKVEKQKREFYIPRLNRELNLAIYTHSDFILPSRLEKYTQTTEDRRIGNLSRAGRERGIRQLMSINLLKRLESSVNSFRLTLTRIRKYIEATMEAIDREAMRHVENVVCDYDFSFGLDFDEREDTVFIGNRKTKIDLADMDYVQWRGYLAKDLDNLNTLLYMLEDITPEHDSKFQMLLADIRNKIANPINATTVR